MQSALSEQLEFRADLPAQAEQEFFSSLPAGSAVFVLRAADETAEPYVGKTSNLRRRMLRMLGESESASRRLNLRERVRSIGFQRVGSDFEAQLVLYRVLRAEFPHSYERRLRLRPAPLIRMLMENAYPRVTVTSRITSLRGESRYYGPFPSRAAAEQFANDALDFFKLRRCTEELNPDSAFPGCVYSEMKMCMAPCFKGCSDEEYASEAARVEQFFSTGGHTLALELTHARDQASEQMEFERAATLHTQLEKLHKLRSQLPEIVHRVDRLDAVMVQPSHLPGSVALIRVRWGRLCAPVQLMVNAPTVIGSVKTPSSMESRISAALELAPAPEVSSAQEWIEHLAILKRWFYRTAKVGEIFFADEKGELPMRRVVRGVSRVFKGEKPQGDLSETAGDYWAFRAKEIGLE